MRGSYKHAILVTSLLFCGCAINHDYAWTEYRIAPQRIPPQQAFANDRNIQVIRGHSNNEKVVLASLGPHVYYGTDQLLTDAIADQLTREILDKGVEITNLSEKSLEVTVDRSEFERGWNRNAANIDFTVKFGSGKTKSYSVRNSSPANAGRLYDGAVALSVIKILNDPEVLTYINE